MGGWRGGFAEVRGQSVSQIVLYSTVGNFNLLARVALVFSFRSKLHSSIELVLLPYNTVLTVRSTVPLGAVSYLLSVRAQTGSSTDQSCL